MKETVVLYPVAGMGHMAPMVELAKFFISHGFAVTIVVVDSPYKHDPVIASFVNRVSSAHPAISFHQLPPVPTPPNPNPFVAVFESLLLSNSHLRDFLHSLRRTASVRALVLDMFSTTAFDVTTELHIPAYLFFTSAAFCLAAFLYFPTLLSNSVTEFKDLGDTPVLFPGLPPIPASHIPIDLQDRSRESYRTLMYHIERLQRADAFLENSFESLEPRAVRALKDGLSLPGRPTPPVYYIGPLISKGRGGEEKHECLSWLDNQPKASVVFLCFGSMGTFSAEQLTEMAAGLEKSGQRFLWVVRSPKKGSEPDLDAILPEGFLERTKERGLVVKSWAPQVDVLGHEAVGAFVSHCGWNSTLEAVSGGVPLIAWPLYAEQHMNKVLLVEEMRLAVAVEGYETGLVGAVEVETKIRWLMESEGGRELRERMRAAKEQAVEAWMEGGSSHAAWTEVVRVLKGGDACAGGGRGGLARPSTTSCGPLDP